MTGFVRMQKQAFRLTLDSTRNFKIYSYRIALSIIYQFSDKYFDFLKNIF